MDYLLRHTYNRKYFRSSTFKRIGMNLALLSMISPMLTSEDFDTGTLNSGFV